MAVLCIKLLLGNYYGNFAGVNVCHSCNCQATNISLCTVLQVHCLCIGSWPPVYTLANPNTCNLVTHFSSQRLCWGRIGVRTRRRNKLTLCLYIRHANIIHARMIICAAKTNRWCSGGEKAEKQVTFARQKIEKLLLQPFAAVSIRMSEHARRCRCPCRVFICRAARTRCLSSRRTWTTLSSNSLNILSVLCDIVAVHLSAPARWSTKLCLRITKACLEMLAFYPNKRSPRMQLTVM